MFAKNAHANCPQAVKHTFVRTNVRSVPNVRIKWTRLVQTAAANWFADREERRDVKCRSFDISGVCDARATAAFDDPESCS